MGPFHKQFETDLKEFLGVKYISLVVNGTTALMLALKALDIRGEVITTPFSFVATSHVLYWNKIKPVFVDIEPDYFTIDPEKIINKITKNTAAIMPVHVFGNSCQTNQIKEISKEYKLPVIYDASHAFGVTVNKNSILTFGDLSVVSFHATKAFNTFEGGAIISSTEELKDKIDKLKNFGFIDETSIDGVGINGKMNELQAALGILQLKHFHTQVSERNTIGDLYKVGLKKVKGISLLEDQPGVEKIYTYFPILVDPLSFGHTRDDLYNHLKKSNIYTRRYFYPLISDIPIYSVLPTSSQRNLPVSVRISQQILCLPIYPDLSHSTVFYIIDIINCFSR
jgi:dTDP-4-amino-4,6-dideoxygalactose transaminase